MKCYPSHEILEASLFASLKGQFDSLKFVPCAGCVDALAEEKALLYCFWLVHRPPDETLLQLALRCLDAMAENPATSWSACAQAGALYLMTYLLQANQPPPTQQVSLLCICFICLDLYL